MIFKAVVSKKTILHSCTTLQKESGRNSAWIRQTLTEHRIFPKIEHEFPRFNKTQKHGCRTDARFPGNIARRPDTKYKRVARTQMHHRCRDEIVRHKQTVSSFRASRYFCKSLSTILPIELIQSLLTKSNATQQEHSLLETSWHSSNTLT